MTSRRNLTIVVSAAGPATDIDQLIKIADRQGWDCAVIATPNARPFINETLVEELTGTPPRFNYASRPANTPRTPGNADALIIAPATFNTINKLAAGIADSYALTTAAEHIGHGLPTLIVPFVNTAFASRAPFIRSLNSLRDEGVQVYWGPGDGWEPHQPGGGTVKQQDFPWKQAFDMLTGQSKDQPAA